MRTARSKFSIHDDIFGNTRMIDPEANERHCNDKLHRMSRGSVEEFELSFVYGVESTNDDASFIFHKVGSYVAGVSVLLFFFKATLCWRLFTLTD
jgi:hypothetical protein